MLRVLAVEPKQQAQATVIWLHGLGASGYDFVDIVPELNLSQEAGIRFIFPHAPVRKVQYAGNSKIRAWFNVTTLDRRAQEDEAGIRDSEKLIRELIANETSRGIPNHKIILAGFSQGGVMALHTGLRYPEKLAGILVLSAWLPLKHTVLPEKHASNQQTPILMCHGTNDELIPINWAEESKDYLQNIGYDIKLLSYSMAHTVCQEEIELIGNWCGELL